MKMQKVQFRIGELAKQLAVEKFVIRFWEKEFNLLSTRSGGGQRFYTKEDLNQFKTIKSLLYEKGFTIAGAKKLLALKTPAGKVVGSYKTQMHTADKRPAAQESPEAFIDKLTTLRHHLVTLRDLL
jgi:DNA-binding transcriptional MerR regulator